MGLHSAVVSLTLYAASEMLANIILREVLSMVCAAGVFKPPPVASTAERRERCPVYS